MLRESLGKLQRTKDRDDVFTINMWDVRLADDKVVDLKIPKSHNAILFVREGGLNVFESDERLQAEKVTTGAASSPGDGDTIRISP